MRTAFKPVFCFLVGAVWAGSALGQDAAASPPAAAPSAVPAAPSDAAAKPRAKSTAQSDAGEPRAATSPGAGTGRPSAAPHAAGTAARPPGAVDRLDLGTATVTGDREQPKVMYIVPWKRADIGDLSGKPMNSLLDEALAPIDRDEFKREVAYYDAVKSDASQNGASKAAVQGEK